MYFNDTPLGTGINNIEITLVKGGQLTRVKGFYNETDYKRGGIHSKITCWRDQFDI